MEGFSDGVFAFAATLLVVDLSLHPPGSPLEQVLQSWPAYLAYLISFLTISAAWLAHSGLSDRLTHTDWILLRLNLLVLLFVAFLPFPTRLVGEALHATSTERVFITMYGLTLLAIRLCGYALGAYAAREHLYPTDADDEPSEQRAVVPVLTAYLVAIVIGLAVPQVAVAVYLGIAVYLVVPFQEVARLLTWRA
jgi:TMEM175 potassium channel family protein